MFQIILSTILIRGNFKGLMKGSAGNIPKTSICFEDYITPAVSSFTLSDTHCGVVHGLVSSLRVDNNMGWKIFLQDS